MKAPKNYLPLFLCLALMITIMSACGNNTSNALSPLQVVEKSISAMKNLKTSHIVLNMVMEVNAANIPGIQTPSDTNGVPAPSTIAANIKGSGDQSIPDKQMKMDFTLNVASTSVQISEITTSDKFYIKTPNSQWYSIDQASDAQLANSLGSSLPALSTGQNLDESSILTLIEHSKFTDHGDQNLNGLSLRHLTVTMDKTAFQQLLSTDPQLKSTFGSQDLNSLQDFRASVDVYIDENQFYIHRAEVKVSYTTDVNGTSAKTNVDSTTDLSNFNKPVTITVPDNATPLTDPSQLLGS